MRICHSSDNHGRLNKMFGLFDVVVSSGDFFPDPPGNPQFKSQVGLWQIDWLEHNIPAVQEWLNGSPFLFTLGNHDWAKPKDIVDLLNKYGIVSFCLHDRIVDYGGVHFYGFPYVPAINGQYNYEREIPEMQKQVKKMVHAINGADYVDVLVCHAPPYQTLDFDGRQQINIGSTVIAGALDYQIKQEKMPSHYLCGHIHSANGIVIRNKVLCSNAATTHHILEIK